MLNISKYITVALASTLKFLGGPIAGFALGISVWETAFASAAGMMFTVCLILFAERFISPIIKLFSKKKSKVFTKSKRRYVQIKLKFGLAGIALLTPFLLTPPIGTFIAASFKFPKTKILLYMLPSAIIGGIVQSWFIYFLPTLKSLF